MKQPDKKTFFMPTSYFGITLGLFSLGLAYRYAQSVLPIPTIISTLLLGTATLLWVIFIGITLYRIIAFRETFYAELKHPIQGCFVSLIPITTILLGTSLVPNQRPLASVLITLGIISQLLFSSYHTGGMWKGNHTLTATTPVIYLPTIAASFASAIGLGALGYDNLGKLFFGAGVFSWMSFEAISLHRVRTEELETNLRPIIGIQLAPAFVACAAYLSVNGGKVDTLAQMLIGYGLLNAFFLIRLAKWIIEDGFKPSFWAFSFGLGSMANTGAHMYVQYNQDIIATIGLVMFIVGSLLILALILGTLRLLIRRNFFAK